MQSNVRTRFMILSDTHGCRFGPTDRPLACADVAIHCGDLTDGSTLEEFRTTIELLVDINAPLKLVIAGNHDFTMDFEAFQKQINDASPALDPVLVKKEYGIPGEARRLFEDAGSAGIVFLEEGIHSFTLQNGALLTVFASPYTPALGAWGFQYLPDVGHNFHSLVEEEVDVFMTHGPPQGIMDYTNGRERAGCPDLFTAVARVRPKLHCFGHIHEGWGAKLVTWRNTHGEKLTHFTSINNDRSYVIEKLSSFKPSSFDFSEDVQRKLEKLEQYNQFDCCMTSHCINDEHPISHGEQTLFVNASVCGDDHAITQKPWIVDIELPVASASSKTKSCVTPCSEIAN